MSWFKKNPNAFQIKQSQFTKLVKKGDICDLTLVSDENKGFLIVGRFSKAENSVCVLVNSGNLPRYIKSPDKAHDYLYKLGVESFNIDTFSWEVEKALGINKTLKSTDKKNKAEEKNIEQQPCQDDNIIAANKANEYEAELENLNKSSYKIQQQEFIKMHENGDICDLGIVSNKDKGFFITGKLKRDDKGHHRCILVNQRGHIRYIKSPGHAHDFMYKLGVKNFNVDTQLWDQQSVFNPHKASSESRLRKKNRNTALQSKGSYVEKLRAFCGLDENKIATIIQDIAPDDKHVKDVIYSYASKQIPEYISDKLVEKFVSFLTLKGVFPQNQSEAIVFGYYWGIEDGSNLDQIVNKMPAPLVKHLSENSELNRLVELSIEDRLKRI